MSFWNWVKEDALPWIGNNIFGIADAATDVHAINEQTRIAEMNYNLAEKYNKLNYDNMVENQQYNRALQQDIFAREDNAVQRRAKDLESAGLSKTLAAGSAAGAGSIVTSTAAQRGYSPKDASAYKQLADLNIFNNLRHQTLQNAELAHNLDIARKAGVSTNANNELAEALKLFAGVFDIDIAKLGVDAVEKLGEIFDTYFGQGQKNVFQQTADVATGKVSKNDVSPIVQISLDVGSTLDPTDNDKLTYANQVNTKLPNGTKRQSKSFGGYGGYSGGKNFKSVWVK